MGTAVGFIGLGNMGLPMALNLCAPEFDLQVYDVNPVTAEAVVARGGRCAANVAELAAASSLICLCVRDDADVKAVMMGPSGIIAQAAPKTAVAIHSTVQPETVKTVAAAAALRQIDVVDAPITGGAEGARARTLAYMVGGPDAVIDRFRPVFAASGSTVVAAGALGAGMVLKLCNNLITYLELIAAHESVHLARSAGVSMEALVALTTANGGMTKTMLAFLENRTHGPAKYGEATMRRAFESFAGIAEKDLDCALGTAADCGIELPAGTLARQLIRDVYLAR
jgi:3-hydroxyisobutyrate dehydrogenase